MADVNQIAEKSLRISQLRGFVVIATQPRSAPGRDPGRFRAAWDAPTPFPPPASHRGFRLYRGPAFNASLARVW